MRATWVSKIHSFCNKYLPMNLKQSYDIQWILEHLHYQTKERAWHSSSPLMPKRPQEVHFKVWWMVQKVWSTLWWEFTGLNSIFELQAHPICHGFFFLKEKKMSYLVHKAAKQNSLQTVNNTFKIQKQKLKTLSSLAQRWYAMAISSKITGNVRIRTI